MKKLILRGKECYVCEGRLTNTETKNGFYYYDMRSCDDDMSLPSSIELDVLVNHWGTIACKEALTLEHEWRPGTFEMQLTDQESMYIASIAAEDRKSEQIIESEEVSYYAEDMEPDDEEEESEFIANYDDDEE